MFRPALFLLGLFALLSAQLPSAQGQKKAAGPTFPPVPQAPILTSPANLGVKRGTSAELTLTGTNLADPTGVLISPPLKAGLIAGKKGGDAAKLRVKVEAPADCPIGLYTIRVAAKNGVSNFRPLIVDEVPEVVEVETNKTKDSAQDVPVPCVVLGRADVEAVDFFRVKVKAGQKLTFEVLGRRIGSPIDPFIVLHDGKTKREMVDLYADDTPGLQSDARLTHTFKEPGEVLVEVRDTTYRGGPDFAYRLRIGEFPGATTAFPLAIERGKAASIGFSGPDAADVPAVAVTAPSDSTVRAISVSPKRATGISGWPVPVRVSDHPELVEQEPNNDPAKANKLPVPGGVSARFGAPSDLDYFQVVGKKGQKLIVSALTHELSAPTEVLFRVLDAKGAELAKSNPALNAARVEFTPAADGDFLIVCEHLNYLSGPNEVYHLSIRPASQDFEFALPLDRAEAPAGGGTAVAVTGINRLNGYDGPIELSIVGDPALSGTFTVPAGATSAYLPLRVKEGAAPGPYSFAVRGQAKVGDKAVVRFATATEPVKAALANLPNLPENLLGQAAVGVIEKPPFTLTVSADPSKLDKRQKGKLLIEASRNGYDGEIVLASVFVAPNVTVTPKPIAKGAKKVELEVAVAESASGGPAQVVLKGTAKVGGKDYVVLAAPAVLDVAGKVIPPKKDKPKGKGKK